MRMAHNCRKIRRDEGKWDPLCLHEGSSSPGHCEKRGGGGAKRPRVGRSEIMTFIG